MRLVEAEDITLRTRSLCPERGWDPAIFTSVRTRERFTTSPPGSPMLLSKRLLLLLSAPGNISRCVPVLPLGTDYCMSTWKMSESLLVDIGYVSMKPLGLHCCRKARVSYLSCPAMF